MKSTTNVLLDRWKAAQGIQSDNQAAIRLGITRATVSSWRHEKSHAEAVIAAKMVKALEVDLLAVLASIEADRARNEETRRVWARFGKGAFMALLVGFSLAGPTRAAVLPSQQSAPLGTDHPIMRSRRRRPRRPVLRVTDPQQRVCVGMGRSRI